MKKDIEKIFPELGLTSNDRRMLSSIASYLERKSYEYEVNLNQDREELMAILKSKVSDIKKLEEEKLIIIEEKTQLLETLKKLKEENEVLNLVILRAKKENTHLRKKIEELEEKKVKTISTDKIEDENEKIQFNQKLKKSRELI